MCKGKAILLIGLIAVLSIALTAMAHGHDFLVSAIRFLGALGVSYTIYTCQNSKKES